EKMARPVAKTRRSGCAAARGTFAGRVRPNNALQCDRPAATSRRLGSLARFARLAAPERQRYVARTGALEKGSSRWLPFGWVWLIVVFLHGLSMFFLRMQRAAHEVMQETK